MSERSEYGSDVGASSVDSRQLPLVFDLDRTLIRTDAGIETLMAVLARNPLQLIALTFVFLTRGIAAAKRWLVRRAFVRPELMPINDSVVEYARDQASLGRPVLLVTASDQAIADAFGSYFGFFSEAIGSDGQRNLKGVHKASYLAERFGERGFVYVGDSKADLKVWERAGAAVVVEYSDRQRRLKEAEKCCSIEAVFPVQGKRRESSLWIKQLRVHQWAKNLLLAVPLLLAHQATDVVGWLAVLWSIVVFSMIASCVYILNDISDIEVDRRHESKRHRPIAAGTIKIESALSVALLLLFGAFMLSWALVPALMPFAGLYFLLTSVYSWWGKEQLVLDLVLLASLYCLRLIAGGVAASVEVSHWLLMFAAFLFVSLACIKRVAELNRQRAADPHALGGGGRRAYRVADVPILSQLGIGSGLVSVLVCALYFSSPDVTGLYGHPVVLFAGVLPIMLFWVARIWVIVNRPLDTDLEDPVLFALTDRVSLVCALACMGLVWLAI